VHIDFFIDRLGWLNGRTKESIIRKKEQKRFIPNMSTSFRDVKRANREAEASRISKIFMLWFIPILRMSSKEISHPSQDKQEFTNALGDISPQDDPKLLFPKFETAWDEELEKPEEERSLFKVMLKIVGYRTLLIGTILSVIQAAAGMALPFVMKRLLISLSDTSTQVSVAEQWICVGLMVLLPYLASMCQAHVLFLSKRGSVRLYATLTQAIFLKSLKLSCASRNQSSTGQIVNLMASDASTAIERAVMLIYPLFLAPIQLAILLFLIYDQIGIASCSGIAVMLIVTPVNLKIFINLTKMYGKTIKHTDTRINLINEAIQSIRILKMYAWEIPFISKIEKVRDIELKYMRKHAYLLAVGLSAVFLQLPFLIQYASFSTYYAQGNAFYPYIIFPAIQLFAQIQQTLTQLPQAVSQLSQTIVASRRIATFLQLAELTVLPGDSIHLDDKPHGDLLPGTIVAEQGTFIWEAAEIPQPRGKKNKVEAKADLVIPSPTLTDINISIQPGEKVAVIGQVGSGKSSLLAAITGEMTKSEGRISCHGSIALHPQKPFIITGTVRDNITFGNQFQLARYKKVVSACCLEDDFQLLPKGDECVVGERGINLSGGQKARISLARAVYADNSILLLDDPLSAVDAHVGQHILEHCIYGSITRGKTLIFVTNKVDNLDGFDQVIWLVDGKISKIGRPNELSLRKLDLDVEEVRDQSSRHAVTEEPEDNKADIYTEEEEETGAVKFSVLVFYVRAIGVVLFIVAYTLYSCYLFTPMLSQYVLGFWTDDTLDCLGVPDCVVESQKWFVIYSSLLVGGLVMCIIAGALIAEGRISGSRTLHSALVHSTFSASIPEFFDVTPVGRIINRFSKDIGIIDVQLSQMMMFATVTTILVLSGFIGMILGTGFFFAIIVVPVLICYLFIYSYSRGASIVLQRGESRTRAPLYSGFAEVLNGLQTIRAFGQQERFFIDTRAKLTENVAAFVFVRVALPACLTMGINLIGTLITASVASFIVGTDYVQPGQAGLALGYSISVSQTMNYCLIILLEVNVMMNSVERVQSYCENVIPEQSDNDEESKGKAISPGLAIVELESSWPQHGSVVISNLTLGYRNGPDVIHSISLTIDPGEKIGIVGRTGSGKSSLLLGLLFVIRPRNGSISIDGVDISTITLQQLRSRVGIIPQDPVCFQGTIRFNLDPFDLYTEEELLHILKICQLQSFELDHEILEGGENVSVGQRQMICFGRAILRKSKLLMLDEATASVDHETDNALQSMIREVFADRTVITIAHRLNTVMDSDRILVMKDGNIAEFDSPATLLAKDGGLFKSMAEAENE